jgi:hypothetical protein
MIREKDLVKLLREIQTLEARIQREPCWLEGDKGSKQESGDGLEGGCYCARCVCGRAFSMIHTLWEERKT